MKIHSILTILLAPLLAVSDAEGQEKPDISFIFDGGESHSPAEFRRALAGIEDYANLRFFSSNTGGEPLLGTTDLSGQDLIFIDGETDKLQLNEAQLQELKSSNARVVVVNPKGLLEGNVDLDSHASIPDYWANRSIQNDRSLTLYMLDTVLEQEIPEPIDPPVIYPEYGFYHPEASALFPSSDSYQQWYATYRAQQGWPVDTETNIGIIGHLVWVLKGQTAPLDSMIKEIEQKGQRALTLVHRGAADFENYLIDSDEAIVDVLLYSGEMLNHQDQAAGMAQAQRLGVPLLMAMTYHTGSAEDYRASPGGLAPSLTPRVVFSERDGVIEPLVMATRESTGNEQYTPWSEQVAWRVDRAISWARLGRLENHEKRIVMTYWSEAGGKADVGGDPDDFLDVPASALKIMESLKAQGYDLGAQELPDAVTLGRRMAEEASNIGGWAPGRIAELVGSNSVSTLPEKDYLAWYNALPEIRRAEIEAAWGPAPGNVMVHEGDTGERLLILPRLQYGNVVLAPHPMWGYYEDEQVLMSTGALPPHHQYLAFFLWMQKEWRSNAWVSLFSNLPLQPGKGQGPLFDEHIGIMLGAIPHIHPERLGANGGPATRRKTLAQLLGWYNVVVPTSELGNYAELGSLLQRFNANGDPQARSEIADVLRSLLLDGGLSQALAIDVSTAEDDVLVASLDTYLQELQSATAPWGGRILGTLPEDDARIAMVGGMLGQTLSDALLNSGFDVEENRKALLARVMLDNQPVDTAIIEQLGRPVPEVLFALEEARRYSHLLDQAPQELDSILAALNGEWIEPGLAGEAYRNPDVLPSGRSVYGFDPAMIPTVEAEAIGRQQAEALIAAHRDKNNGEYPDELAFVLWSGEIAKSHGITEAQILHLLGTRPVRNWRGQVTGVELIPREELGRPRIDVLATTSGVYRDQFQDKAELIAQAVALAAASEESDNPVYLASASAEQAMLDQGESSEMARLLALARVFSPAPGAYSPSIQFLAKSGDLRGDEARMAELYSSRMSHAYGNGLYGQSARNAFDLRLGSMSAATLSRSSDVNGLLDHPMSAAFLGGLNLAAKAITGRDIELYVSNIRDTANVSIETASASLQRELNTRYFNPDWLRANMDHGYDGARNFMFLTDHLDLWDATATQMVSSEDWNNVNDVFVNDRFNLEMDTFFDTFNPYAQQMLLTNLLGASMRDDWNASEEQLQVIAERLTRSVSEHGPACEANQCRNSELTEFVQETLQDLPDAAPGLAAYVEAIAAATGGAPGTAPEVEGQRMEQVFPEQASALPLASWLATLWIGLLALSLLGAGWLHQGAGSRVR